jgi:hypothetical protein
MNILYIFLFTVLYILLCKLRIGVAITFWTCIREVLSSNLGRHTAYLDRRSRCFPQSFLANTGILSRQATTASFQILSSQYSSMILPFGAVWSRYSHHADYVVLQGGFTRGFPLLRYTTIRFYELCKRNIS